ncbi:MAG: hypothetical protein H6551_01165 [Chitinophagales bacterium]|nr:hypothetical protein [Chitinophagaceae bacterium]MCB9063734.1 hypothetical protein [Chitinophagales bacterium]
MKAIYLSVLLSLPITSVAQVYHFNEWEMSPLNGNPKLVRYVSVYSDNLEELRTLEIDTNLWNIDSFNITGQTMVSYRVVNGALNPLARYNYQFDNKGNVVKRLCYDEKGDTSCRIVYTYNSRGDLIEEKHFVDDTTIGRHYKFSYKSGLCTLMLELNQNCDYKTTYKYDKSGRMLEEIHYYDRDTPSIKYIYDVIENTRSFWVFSRLNSKTTFDNYHNEILCSAYNRDGSIFWNFITEYVYDSLGNWTRRIEDDRKDNGIISNWGPWYKLTVREIEYY